MTNRIICARIYHTSGQDHCKGKCTLDSDSKCFCGMTINCIYDKCPRSETIPGNLWCPLSIVYKVIKHYLKGLHTIK